MRCNPNWNGQCAMCNFTECHFWTSGPVVWWNMMPRTREQLGKPGCSAGRHRRRESKHVIPFPTPYHTIPPSPVQTYSVSKPIFSAQLQPNTKLVWPHQGYQPNLTCHIIESPDLPSKEGKSPSKLVLLVLLTPSPPHTHIFILISQLNSIYKST